MKILAAVITTTLILALPLQSFAAKGGEKGPSDRAWEHADENASFKREGDKENCLLYTSPSPRDRS